MRVYHWPNSVLGLISKSNSEPSEVNLDSDHSVVNAFKMIENEIMNTFVNHVLKCGLKVIADNLPEKKSLSRTNYYSVLFDRPTLAVNELLTPVIDTFIDKILNLMTNGKVFIIDKSDSNHSSLSQSSIKSCDQQIIFSWQ